MKTLTITPLLLLTLLTPVLAGRDLFEHWYPEYGFIFQRLIHEKCSTEYAWYKTRNGNHTYMHEKTRYLGAGPSKTEELVVPLVNCLMESCPEFMKSNMASANVLLGLAPVMLAALGSNLDETSILTVIGNRPILALALAAGSTSVISMRPFEHRDPLESLKPVEGAMIPTFFPFYIEALISVFEHVMVFAAVANVATLGYALGHDTIMAFAPGYTYLILIWAFFTPIVHVMAAIALRIRARYVREEVQGESGDSYTYMGWFRWMLIGYSEDCLPRRVVLKRDNAWSLLMSWGLSLCATCHVILGTLAFSSMLFISARDGVAVLGRFMASVVVCRLILSYELAKLRVLYNSDRRSLSGLSGTGSYHYLMSWPYMRSK
ncbi:hypothetical protein N7493_011046 [Penicillium malachiteum]|uniref:Uncharacterized protein n=1 Tax=Penicillium malachiteum TaxID=1324776 RepID=A0AAD6HBF0_9EURO|nr:hypothetical protein N7493_011046 [Penicillium malachiteum]